MRLVRSALIAIVLVAIVFLAGSIALNRATYCPGPPVFYGLMCAPQ